MFVELTGGNNRVHPIVTSYCAILPITLWRIAVALTGSDDISFGTLINIESVCLRRAAFLLYPCERSNPDYRITILSFFAHLRFLFVDKHL